MSHEIDGDVPPLAVADTPTLPAQEAIQAEQKIQTEEAPTQPIPETIQAEQKIQAEEAPTQPIPETIQEKIQTEEEAAPTQPIPETIQEKIPAEEEEEQQGVSWGVIAVIIILVIAVIGEGTFISASILQGNGIRSSAAQTPLSIVVTPQTRPLFSDSFQSNTAGWDTTQPNGGKIALSGGKLTLESDNHGIVLEFVPEPTFSDFRLDVDAELVQGSQANGYGIYIRGASTQNSVLGLYYRFEVYGDGTFAIYKGTQNVNGQIQSSVIKAQQANAAIYRAGRMNHLTILAQGASMIFQVNGITVYSFTDTSYKSGSVSLYVSNVFGVPADAQAIFEKLAIFPSQS
jgi:hypothetical protein